MKEISIDHIRGDTFKKSITISDGTNPINITGSTIKFTIKADEDDATPLVQVTASLTNPTLGEAQITVSAASMDAVPAGVNLYDIEWTNATNEKTTILLGKINIIQDVTT